MESLTVLITKAQKDWVTQNGNASHLIRKLIAKDMKPYIKEE